MDTESLTYAICNLALSTERQTMQKNFCDFGVGFHF